MIVLPPAFDPARKYPLLVLIHGGAASNNPDQIGLRWNYHLLAAPGYVVLMTDYTGSTSFGEKFAQAIKLDPLKTPGDEINQAVDEAIKRYPYIDATRDCAPQARATADTWPTGSKRPPRATGASSATPARSISPPSGAPATASTAAKLTNGGPPWEGNPVWRDQSPITYAANWKTPMLLSIGERDFRVPINNTLENWSTLQRMHVPSRLLVWPDAWHWILKPEDSRHFYEEVQKWLAAYLKDAPPPDERPRRVLRSVGEVAGSAYETGDVVVQHLERCVLGVDHVARVVELVLDIRLQVRRNRQVMHLVDALVERRRQIVIPGVQLNLQVRIDLHGVRKVGHHVGTLAR